MKIGIIIGTRPEIIKMCSIIRLCSELDLNFFLVHSNQHYTKYLDEIFFKELNLNFPKYNLNVGSASHAKQTGLMLERIEKVLIKENPDIVLVQGDTNTVLAGALAASKLQIKVGHIESGLRSYDRNMPEEINRIITDHISDFLFTPTRNQEKILINEGISRDKIYTVGNTIVDAIFQNLKLIDDTNLIKFNVKKDNYFLVTIHRAENTNVKTIKELLMTLDKLSLIYKLPILYPIHPRTEKIIKSNKIKIPDTIKTMKPVGYLDFLTLINNAKLVLTDSGGIQEEACIMKIPCVTLRTTTERPETVQVGANIVAGINSDKIIKSAKKMIIAKRKWNNPFGDGRTGNKIIEVLIKKFKNCKKAKK